MAVHVSKARFKANAMKCFRQIESSGEPVVITDHGGRPTLEVRLYRHPAGCPLDLLRGSVLRYDHSAAPVVEADWEAIG